MDTLAKALDGYFAPTTITNYNCGDCKGGAAVAAQRTELACAPRVLVVQLARLNLTDGSKDSRTRFADLHLSLARYLDGGASDADYRLVAVVCHAGAVFSAGHFTTVAEACDGKLYTFNDSSMEQVEGSFEDVACLATDAYLMLYESKSWQAIACLTGHDVHVGQSV
jgi:uncharacterized UBP type Zn finger protein